MQKVGEDLETIGIKLKEARELKGYSLEDVSKKTKLLVPYIKAIEEGNVNFFTNDISYLGYYIRYYATAVDFDYEEIREEVDKLVDDVTRTLDLSELQAEDMNEPKKAIKSRINKKRKKVDVSFISFVIAGIALVGILLFVSIKYLPKLINSDPVDKPQIVLPEEKPEDEEKPVEEENSEEVETVRSELVFVEPDLIEVKGLEQGLPFEIEVIFKAPQTWIAVNVDGNQVAEPLSQTYSAEDTIKYVGEVTYGQEIEFHMGIMSGNEFYFNGEKIELDEAVQNSNSVVKLKFRFVEDGEVDEYSQ